MGIVSVDTRDPTPIYAQLERGLRAAIATGRLRPGDQLPTVRQLAVDLRVNANTVARVYAELERAGVIETRRGVGSFVRPRRRRPTRRASTTAACARSSPACWPTPTPPVSRSTMCRCWRERSSRRDRRKGRSVDAPHSSTGAPAGGRDRQRRRLNVVAVLILLGSMRGLALVGMVVDGQPASADRR